MVIGTSDEAVLEAGFDDNGIELLVAEDPAGEEELQVPLVGVKVVMADGRTWVQSVRSLILFTPKRLIRRYALEYSWFQTACPLLGLAKVTNPVWVVLSASRALSLGRRKTPEGGVSLLSTSW